jgi:hypothetical protein
VAKTNQELAQEQLDSMGIPWKGAEMKPFSPSINPFNPNFRATIGSKLREWIDDSGIGGGYRQGLINAGEGIETAIDFTPIIGDAVGVGDIRTSYNQGDMVGTGINTAAAAVGALPIIGDFAAKGVKSALRGLEIGPEIRMKRAEEQGYEPIYHGSTYDIERIDLNGMNPESHFGRGFYSTTSPRDASDHYAGEGPDLTNRLQRRAEQLEGEGVSPDKAMNTAREELKGGNEGVVYPLMGRTTKAFDISNDGDTFLRYEQPELNPEDYLDEADGDMDVAYELAQEAAYDFEPEGELVDFLKSLRSNSSLSQDDFATLQSSILEEAYDGGISANRLDEIFRQAEIYPEDDAGNLISNDVFRQAIQDSGYDTIIHEADIFRGMDVDKGTKHKIFLDPTRVRSINAEFDPAKMDSADLLSSVGTTSALRGIV